MAVRTNGVQILKRRIEGDKRNNRSKSKLMKAVFCSYDDPPEVLKYAKIEGPVPEKQ